MRSALALAVTTLLAGCVGAPPEESGAEDRVNVETEDTGSGGGGTTTTTASGYLDRIAEIYCEGAFSCRATYPGDAVSFEATWSTDVPACIDSLITAWNATAIEQEIAKGRVAFDGTAAIACLAGVSFGSCAEHWQTGIQWAEACYHVLVGLVPVGGSCDSDYACQSGFCDVTQRQCL